MKAMIALIAVSMLAACASNKTTTEPTQAAPAAQTTKAESTAAAAKTEKTSAKASKKSVVKTETAGQPAVQPVVASATEVNCTAAQDVRKLAITTKNAGCELHYTKAAETKVIATQINGDAKCQEVLNTVKEKLVASKFECK